MFVPQLNKASNHLCYRIYLSREFVVPCHSNSQPLCWFYCISLYDIKTSNLLKKNCWFIEN